MPVISYPIPPESNPAIRPEFYQPNNFVISAITRGITTTVTNIAEVYPSATVNNNFVVGQLVRFIIPPTFGIRQLNQKTGYVISLPATNQVEVDIDSRLMDAYIASSATSPAQIIPVGDINSGRVNATGRTNTGTYILGSFIDISPL